jgi:hypothetical protein
MDTGMAAGLAAPAAARFLAATSPAVRRAAGTLAKTCGSSGTGLGSSVFGGEARRGKAGVPQEANFSILASSMLMSWLGHRCPRKKLQTVPA